MTIHFGRNLAVSEAHRLNLAGDYASAKHVCHQLLRQHPNDPDVLHALGVALDGLGEFDEAISTLKRAIRHRSAHPGAYHELSYALGKLGRFREAERAIDSAIALDPDASALLCAKANLFIVQGRAAEAARLLLPLVEAGKHDPVIAPSFARVAAAVGRQDQAIAMLERSIAEERLPPLLRADLFFRLASLKDGLGDYDGAFSAWREANALRRETLQYDPEYTAERVTGMIAAWTQDALKNLPVATVKSTQPVFIVGMPRSGTSLVEQILGSHPIVAAGGELNDVGRMVHEWQPVMTGSVPMLSDLSALTRGSVDKGARAYLRTIQKIGPVAERVTDKMPMNFLHLGVISRLFPRARVIHCVRNPIDTCLSCFFQNFSGSNPFAYDLGEVGRFYRLYRSIIAHWKTVLDLPMLDVVYEDLVADQEAQTRRMAAFVGVPWDDSMLRFHESERVVLTASNEQVRRPVYKTSVQRWRRYEKHVAPLVEALGDVVDGA
ncbi:MAG: sulfotransferase [Phycisphaeraceae bacterium]|nr:sulfotransferase [Phycisphaeraceae bacterium]